MIHFFIGTKAHLIKTFPVMIELKEAGCPFDLTIKGSMLSAPPKSSAISIYRVLISRLHAMMKTFPTIEKHSGGLAPQCLAGRLIEDGFETKSLMDKVVSV